MSEPVTQAEIEDVLSSIRRLVSEDSRTADPRLGKGGEVALAAQIAQPQRIHRNTGVQPKTDTANSSQPVTRLVLTPALRVPESKLAPIADTPIADTFVADRPITQDAKDADTAPVSQQASDAATSGKARFEALMAVDAIEFWDEPQDRIAQGLALHDNDPGHEDLAFFNGIAAATAADAAKAAADAAKPAPQPAAAARSADAPWTDPSATLYQAAATTGHAPEHRPEHAPERRPETEAPAVVVKPHAQLNPKVGAVVQKLAEMEAANSARPVLWEPDGSRDTPYAGSDLETLAWEDQDSDAEAAEEVQLAASAPQAETPEENQIAEPETGIEADSSHREAQETPVSEDPEEITEEVTEGAVAAQAPDSPPVDHRDLAETAVTDTALEALAGFSADEGILDEQALRELVSEIVREELQGALGERITRNVRKLVRREIHRALSAQNLL
ncbi:hypothetical protein VWZ88_20075 [Phaeobacter sp. JH20_36]|uniref:hypothetical protein n=1 Tax=unclassified Phaeobacter TaxID=2621772 RepID=UPI003A8A0CE5